MKTGKKTALLLLLAAMLFLFCGCVLQEEKVTVSADGSVSTAEGLYVSQAYFSNTGLSPETWFAERGGSSVKNIVFQDDLYYGTEEKKNYSSVSAYKTALASAASDSGDHFTAESSQRRGRSLLQLSYHITTAGKTVTTDGNTIDLGNLLYTRLVITMPGGIESVSGVSSDDLTLDGNTATILVKYEGSESEITVLGYLDGTGEASQGSTKKKTQQENPLAGLEGYQFLQNLNGYEDPKSAEKELLSQIPFLDIFKTDYYYDAVVWAYGHEPQITDGTTADSFSPDKICTRGQVVTFLWRAYGQPEPASAENPFEDVTEDDYFYKAVLWAVEQGITDGTSPTQFSPYAQCSRAHILTFIYRAAGEPDKSGEGKWYDDALAWAQREGILDGTYSGSFDAASLCSRSNAVEYLYRQDQLR